MPASPYVIRLDDAGRAELESASRRATAPFRLVQRARIVLLAADGLPGRAIAARLGICEDTVRSGAAGTAGPAWAGWPMRRVLAGRVCSLPAPWLRSRPWRARCLGQWMKSARELAERQAAALGARPVWLYLPDRPGDLTGRPVLTRCADQHLHQALRSGVPRRCHSAGR